MPYFASRDGQQLAYIDIGRGRPVVLLHGFGMRAAHWLPLLAGQQRHYRFILPDLRGFGASRDASWTDADVLDQAADDLDALLSATRVDSPILAGLSMGACVSMRYLGKYGDAAISGYINIDQSPRVGNDARWHWGLFGEDQARRFSEFRAVLEVLDGHGPETAYNRLPRRARWRMEWMMARFFGYAFASRALAAGTVASVKLPLLGESLLPRRNWAALVDCMRAYSSYAYDFRDGLTGLRVPMAAFVGLRSRMYPPDGQRQFPRLVPTCRLVPFERAGHALPFEAPWLFRRRIHETLASM